MEMVGKAQCSECETTYSEWIDDNAPKEEKIAARHEFNTTTPLCHGCRGLMDE